jgi:hypothetical protein
LDFDAPSKANVKTWLLQLLREHVQPGAQELLVKAEAACGWQARHLLLGVIQELRDDRTVQSYLRQYLKDTLTDDAVQQALQGEAKANDEYQSTLDDLFRRSALYRSSDQFREAVAFTARFRHYAPYNNMLVKLQKPSCVFYATARDWKARFERDVKEDARPLLILAPMHPVMLVYDLDDTEGKELPEEIRNFATAEGDWEPQVLAYTLHNVERDRILVQFRELGSQHGGFATTRLRDSRYKMRIVIHSELNDKGRYAVLCHELAHIYLGHLGSDRDKWWPYRTNLTHDTVEIEAEAVAFIVCARAGLTTSSAAYVAPYLKEGRVPASASLELIVKVAGKLEEMGKRHLPPRKSRVGQAGQE